MSTNTGIIPEFVKNKYGVTIKKCCASCQTHEPYDSEGPRRLCTFGNQNKIVDKSDLCSCWRMSDMMAKVKLNYRNDDATRT